MNNEELILQLLTQIKDDVSDLKQETSNINARLDSMEVRIDRIEVRLDSMDVRLDSVEERLDSIEERLDSIEERQGKLEQTMIRIENDHGKKLRILFDAYSQLYDISMEIRKNISDLSVSKEKHDLHIKWIDSNLGTVNQ